MKIKILISILTTLLVGFAVQTVIAVSTTSSAIKGADYLISQQQASGSIGGLGQSAWAIQALNAADMTNLAVNQFIEHGVVLNQQSATDIERTILALLATGNDPHFKPVDMVTSLKTKARDQQLGSPDLLNDDIFGIIALLSSNESINDPIVNDSIKYLVNSQRADGSFSWSAQGNGDSNDTAAALEALILAKQKGAALSFNQPAAVDYLVNCQNEDGGFGYQPGQASDAASTSWVIQAITALGQQPEDWLKAGHNPFDYLTSMQAANGGVSWQAGQPPDILTTAFATIAFARKSLPVAQLIVVLPTPSPSPVPSPTTSLVPSPTPSILPSPVEKISPSPAPQPTVSPTPVALNTTEPNPTPQPTPSPSPNPSPTPSPKQFVSTAKIVQLFDKPAVEIKNEDPNSADFQLTVTAPTASPSAETLIEPTPVEPISQVSIVPIPSLVSVAKPINQATSPATAPERVATAMIMLGSGMVGWAIGRIRL